MRTKFYLLALLLAPIFASGQVIAPPDTFLCASDSLVLNATFVGGGGTDQYTDSIIPYNFTTFTGTIYNGPDDQYSGIVSIPFDFCYYGQTYNQLKVSTNNYITFDLTGGGGGFSPWQTQAIPNPGAPLASIMGPWVDINPNTGGTIRYGVVGTAPNRKFIASYENVPMFSCSSLIYNGQIVINEGTNIIETHIGNLPNCSSWNSGNSVHGLHDETGAQAYTVTGRNNSSYTVSNEARAFIPSGNGGVAWFDINGNLLGTGTSITVFPQATTQYIVSAVCGTTFNPAIADTVTVSIGSVGLNFEAIDEDCWQSDNGQAIVNLPNSNTWDVEWFDVSGNSLQLNGNVTGSDTLKGLEAGAYFVQLFDQTNNCTVIDTVFINQPPPIIQNAQIANSFCGQDNGSIDLNLADGFGQLTWSWNDGATTLDRDNLGPGTYVLTVFDSIGCDTSQTFIIEEENPVSAAFNANPPSGLLPLSVQFSNQSSGGTIYEWDFGDGTSSMEENPSHTYQTDGLFEVVLIVTDEGTGCSDTARFTIRVDSEPRLTMPNVFTPGSLFPYFNAITTNDSTANIVEFEGVIYNRWGSVVYTWSDWENMNAGWDGSSGGGTAPEGTYFYYVKARGNNNEVIEESGHFMLLR